MLEIIATVLGIIASVVGYFILKAKERKPKTETEKILDSINQDRRKREKAESKGLHHLAAHDSALRDSTSFLLKLRDRMRK